MQRRSRVVRTLLCAVGLAALTLAGVGVPASGQHGTTQSKSWTAAAESGLVPLLCGGPNVGGAAFCALDQPPPPAARISVVDDAARAVAGFATFKNGQGHPVGAALVCGAKTVPVPASAVRLDVAISALAKGGTCAAGFPTAGRVTVQWLETAIAGPVTVSRAYLGAGGIPVFGVLWDFPSHPEGYGGVSLPPNGLVPVQVVVEDALAAPVGFAVCQNWDEDLICEGNEPRQYGCGAVTLGPKFTTEGLLNVFVEPIDLVCPPPGSLPLLPPNALNYARKVPLHGVVTVTYR